MVFAAILLSSIAAKAQGVCNFLSGAQKTACHDAAVAAANKKAAAAQAKAAANQPPADSTTAAPVTTNGQPTVPANGTALTSTTPTTAPHARTPADIPQINSYRGGTEDCTGSNCSGTSHAEVKTADNIPPCNGTLPGMYCYNGTVSDQAQKVLARHNVTADDAIKCNSVYTVAHTFKMGGGDKAAQHREVLQQIPDSVSSNDRYLWELIYVLSPVVQEAPVANRNNTMTYIRDHQIYNDLDKYQNDFQPLLVEYKSCLAKGLPPSGL
jgi:hypothetical protein